MAVIAVKADSVAISGYSNINAEKTVVYGGIAGGVEPIVGPSNSTVNTCIDANTVGLKACNQLSVHSGLVFSISFQSTKEFPGDGLARMFIDNGGSTIQIASQSSLNVTANSTVITLQTTWADICTNSGLLANCTGTSGLYSKSIKYGIDEDKSGEVDESERKTITLKLHYISSSDTVNQAFCPTTAAGAGICNIEFTPGDSKVFINTAIYALNDPVTGIDWDSIAVFPVATSTGNEANTIQNFSTLQSTPIFKSINAADGTIPDSAVSGSIENYQLYCFVYATKNIAQNIYKFVNDTAAAATACITPSEVVGILSDKSCFISTAAFGSVMAPEVETFRQFRNRYLLTNSWGREFVRNYYQYSPPLANMIADSEILKLFTRALLYPILLFAGLALQIGLWGSLLAMLVLVFAIQNMCRRWLNKKTALIVLILIASPLLKAEIIPDSKTIQHESAKDGLVRITKDGTYIYDIKRPLKNQSSKITFGMAYQPEISIDVEQRDAAGNGTGTFNNYIFEDFYAESSGLILGYDYESYPWVDMGRLGYQIGFGAMFVTGSGILVTTGQPSNEKFTFITLPINAGAVYRFEYKDKQMVAPYVAGGATLLTLLEKREDISKPSAAFGFGFYGAGGVMLNVGAIDPDAGYQLDSEYGISNLWLTAEFRLTEVKNEAFTFSNQYLNAGLSFDF